MNTLSGESRPLGAAVAAVLLGVAALAGLIFGPYLVVQGVLVRNDVGRDAGTLVLTLEVMLGVGCVVLAAVSAIAARAVWRGAGWDGRQRCSSASCS